MPEAAGAKRNTGMAKGYLFLILFAFFVAWQTPFVTILQNHGVPAIGTVTMTFVVAAVLINLIDLVTGRIKTVYREGRQHLKALLLMGALNFMGSIGRTDLEGGNYASLVSSLSERIMTLPPTTVVYTGHGPATTIEHELNFNPYLS